MMFIRWIGLLALFAGVLWVINRLAAQASGWVPHAVSHLTGTAVGGLLLAMGGMHYRRLGRQVVGVGRIGAQVFVAAALLVTLSQCVEALSAVIEYPTAGLMHTASGLATAVSLVILAVGLLAMVFAAVSGRQLPRWVLVVAAVLAAFILFALVFGLG